MLRFWQLPKNIISVGDLKEFRFDINMPFRLNAVGKRFITPKGVALIKQISKYHCLPWIGELGS